jgi:ethanolamine ammonia-lyase large subunit
VPGYSHTVGATTYRFPDLRTLMAKATPARSGDALAGIAAASAEERVAAQMSLAEVPLKRFLSEHVVPYESDEVTRLVLDRHDAAAFEPVAHLTVGDFRNWLLAYEVDEATLAALAPGLTPEMVAAVSKIMRMQDMVVVARKVRVVTRFRNTLGLAGRLATRLQPNHPTDDPKGIAASLLDGLLYGCGDAVIGINPATDNVAQVSELLKMLDEIIRTHAIPTQSCVLTHVTTTIEAIERGAPVDLVFKSIGGTEATNRSFGVTARLLAEANDAARSLERGTAGRNVMYFETGQGSALSANAHHGVDQQTLEARAYGLGRAPSIRCSLTPCRLHRPRVPLRRQGDHPRGAGGPFLRQADGRAAGRRRLLHQPRRGRPGRHGYAADAAGGGGRHLRDGRARRRRRHAQLPVDLVPRRALRARGVRPEARARVRGVAGAHEGDGRGRQVARGASLASLDRRRGEARAICRLTRDPGPSWRAGRRRGLRWGAGASLPTQECSASPRMPARDAVPCAVRLGNCARPGGVGARHGQVSSDATRRALYLQRRLAGACRNPRGSVARVWATTDLAVVIGDGLSAAAVHAHAVPLIAAFLPHVKSLKLSLGPVVIAHGARVALGDEIGSLLRARLVAVLIGERPGLSSPDSRGVYLTFAPKPGRSDAERNCLSNIRAEGLSYALAAFKLAWLVREGLRRSLTGVALKDESDHALAEGRGRLPLSK